MATEQLVIDPGSLTLGELEEVEQVTGASLGSLFEGGITAKVATALVWIIKRRTDPSFTLDDARNLTLGQIDLGGELDPTVAAG